MTKRKPGGREAARAPAQPAREAARSKKTIDVDPRWLEEVKAPMPEAKAGEPNAPVAGAPVRRMTMEVDPVWLEETRGEAAAGLAPPAPGARARRKVSPPPLPPIAAAAKEAPTSAKRKTPPPLPREEPDGGDAKTKPIARRSTRPPRR
jgi:hypothetical protein